MIEALKGANTILRVSEDVQSVLAAPRGQVGPAQRYNFEVVAPDIFEMSVKSRFLIADAWAARGCKAFANKGYADIIRRFVGPAYIGYQTRAKLGYDETAAN